ncbi:MAG: hypothetical protein M1825_004682 [Sarcosagium campestre]|nr:MAG: hypothetical protein M1825_004682 [Sarcosagium campestre]
MSSDEKVRVIEERLKKALERAEAAEKRAEAEREDRLRTELKLRKTTLPEFLDGCHQHLQKTLSVQCEISMTTKGGVTTPVKKLHPRNLARWNDYLDLQRDSWDQVYQRHREAGFPPSFTSLEGLEVLGREHISRPVASEGDLLSIQRYAVESRVSEIINNLIQLRGRSDNFDIGDGIIFENHLNTLHDEQDEVVDRIASLTTPSTPPPNRSGRPAHKARVDQICVSRSHKGKNTLAFIIEYKAPHKVTLASIRTGLERLCSSNSFHRIINTTQIPSKSNDEAYHQYNSELLLAAVLTQIFSYMITSGVEYGYISTGEALILLRIPEDDPTTLLFHVAEPKAEVHSAETCLRNTAVSHALGLALLALRSETRCQRWIADAEARLPTWEQDFQAMMDQLSETIRKEAKNSEYKPKKSRQDHPRGDSPYHTRSRTAAACKEPSMNSPNNRDESPDEREDGPTPPMPPTPTPAAGASRQSKRKRATSDSNSYAPSSKRLERAFCTQKCLLGLVREDILDRACPNISLHVESQGSGDRHSLNRTTFLDLIRDQLRLNRDDDCEPMDLQGSRGALFKVTLASHGYTVVAKGTISVYVPDLQHEASVYQRLQSLQGSCVPVHIGNISLAVPYYYKVGARIVHMMFLSWGGDGLTNNQEVKTRARKELGRSVTEMHRAGILHNDIRAANLVWNRERQRIMIIDFERSELLQNAHETVLSPTSSNKRKRGGTKPAKLSESGDGSRFKSEAMRARNVVR